MNEKTRFWFLVSRFWFLFTRLASQPETRNKKPETHAPRLSLIVPAFLVCAAMLPAAPPPKLVLAVVIDQFRYDYLLRFRADYNSGLARLLDKGAVFTDAHYIHA